jgi:hypothetical protein
VIEDAGVVGDMSGDDSMAIQSAMNAMRDGQVLRFPPGRYMVEHLTLPAGASITLAGPEPDDSSGKKVKDRQEEGRPKGQQATDRLGTITGQFMIHALAWSSRIEKPEMAAAWAVAVRGLAPRSHLGPAESLGSSPLRCEHHFRPYASEDWGWSKLASRSP